MVEFTQELNALYFQKGETQHMRLHHITHTKWSYYGNGTRINFTEDLYDQFTRIAVTLMMRE